MVGAMKKSIVTALLALVAAWTIAIPQALAAPDPSAMVDLQDAGSGKVSVTLKNYDKMDDLLTLSLTLDISLSSGSISYLQPSFQFSSAIDASVKTITTHEEGDKMRVRIYIANASQPLLPAASSTSGVNLGNLILAVKDSAPDDQEFTATVSVPTDEVALQGVRSDNASFDVPPANLVSYSAPTLVVTKESNPVANPSLNQNPMNGGNAADSDTVGRTNDTRPDKLLPTGDNTTPLVIGLVVVAVLAVGLIVFAVVRRRKKADSSSTDA